MLIRDKDLLSLRMVATDGSEHAVADVLVRQDGLRLAYVVADIGAWLADRLVRVGIERFDPPNVPASEWRAAIGAHELEEKPVVQDAPGAKRALPLALFSRSTSGEETDLRDDEGALRSVTAITQGVRVDAEDGRAGTLMGLIFETDDWTARHIVVETGGDGAPEHQRVVPVELLGPIDWPGGTIRLDATRAQVRESPDLHEIDGIEGKWYNKVLAYYGLQS